MASAKGTASPTDLSAAPTEGGKARSRPPVLVVAVLVLGVVVFAWKISGATRKAAPPTPAATETKAVDNQTLTQSAIDTQRQVEIDAMKQRIAGLEEQLRKQPGEIKAHIDDVESKVTREIQGIVTTLEERSEANIRAQKPPLGGSAASPRLDGGITNIPLPAGGGEYGEETPEDSSFPYRRLGGAALVSANNSVASALQNLPAMPAPVTPTGPDARPAAAAYSPESGTDPEVAAPDKPARGLSGTDAKLEHSFVVPAYSYADLRTLHGVTCPVRTSATASLGLSDKPAPIVLPVVGPFRGPQGIEIQTGSIHLFGFCEGMDRLRPTGMIKVEGLSMVRADGSNYTVSINGYVIDARDNDLGVRGVKESVKGRQLAAAMASSMIAAAGDVFNQGSFDTVETQGGNLRQVLKGGKLGSAIGGAAIAAPARELANFFRQYANTLFDVISIEGGTPLKLILEEPIQLPDDTAGADEIPDGRPLL
ncbi:hypothetical protein E4T66_18315 [Sinimarinibacterium sp. CAU 1509]|uniref:hypothetical protein n=1 Tax=Sinimarinibacterium sp. CAU 1509 TaxID=2562283 RepID=UPI0010ACE5F1|nr:hypothetical protein [Sinimarinibacterium sp. CAU 1509]TJY57361.1 hypothetical protein E4T66_18315 [Sinimarinibacterium sp. CAU 1509]